MPGMFSSMAKAAGGYAFGAGKTAMSTLGKAAGGKLGSSATGAFYGAALGGAYGAGSDDTSMTGGALMGAALGAGGARYGGAAKRAFTRGGGPGRMGVAALGQMYGDARKLGSMMMSNAPVARVASSLKNWRSAMR